MAAISVKLEGTEQMKKLMREIRNDTFKKKVLTSTFRKAARPFVKTAKANAPIADVDVKAKNGDIIKRGFMKRAIKSWVSRNTRAAHLFMGVRLSSQQRKIASYWYFLNVEYGSVKRSAKPFLNPAFKQTLGEASQIMVAEFSGVLAKFKTKYGIK